MLDKTPKTPKTSTTNPTIDSAKEPGELAIEKETLRDLTVDPSHEERLKGGGPQLCSRMRTGC